MTAQPIALTWNGFVDQIAALAVVQTQTVGSVLQGVDSWFNTVIPQACNYAELRIQRDLDLAQHQVERTYTLTGGSNKLSLPSNDFVVVDDFYITSSGQTYPLLPVSKEYLQAVYGSSSGSGIPTCFAIYGGDLATFGNTTMVLTLGPWPDQNYSVTIVGQARATSLYSYADNTHAGSSTTYISTYYPDLMLQAAMIPMTEYMRQFGAASNDPQMGVTYETQYQTLLAQAKGEAFRARQEGADWTSEATSPVAAPTR